MTLPFPVNPDLPELCRESHFVSIFESVASEVMGSKALIERKANLFYQLTLNRKLELDVKTASPARAAAEKAVVGRYDKTDLKVRAFDTTAAVSSYRMAAEAAFEGVEIKRQFCITNVWMKRNGNWQIVARHTASLPNDTPPASETCA
jgi:hypothetical protein